MLVYEYKVIFYMDVVEPPSFALILRASAGRLEIISQKPQNTECPPELAEGCVCFDMLSMTRFVSMCSVESVLLCPAQSLLLCGWYNQLLFILLLFHQFLQSIQRPMQYNPHITWLFFYYFSDFFDGKSFNIS